jgi:hypothetical protein
MKVDIVRITYGNCVTELEEFLNKLSLADEANRQYEDRLQQIFFNSSRSDDRGKQQGESRWAVNNISLYSIDYSTIF